MAPRGAPLLNPFVLDASVVVAWLLPDEADAAAASGIIRRAASSHTIVPAHWRLEVVNAVLAAERRKRILPPESDALLGRLAGFVHAVDGETVDRAAGDTLALARRHGLTLYDAAYLELALRLRADLATFDGALRRAASAEEVPLAP